MNLRLVTLSIELVVLAFIFHGELLSQSNLNIVDAKNSGVIFYSHEDYQGKSFRISEFNKLEKVPFTTRSIKILGSYDVNTIGDLVISADHTSINLQSQKFVIVSNGRPKIAIVYDSVNFKGRATYLEAFQIVKGQNYRSIKKVPTYKISILNNKGEMFYGCDDISELVEEEIVIQVKPGICK